MRVIVFKEPVEEKDGRLLAFFDREKFHKENPTKALAKDPVSISKEGDTVVFIYQYFNSEPNGNISVW